MNTTYKVEITLQENGCNIDPDIVKYWIETLLKQSHIIRLNLKIVEVKAISLSK